MDKFTQEEIFRYSRHLMIPDVGLEGQRRLKATSVLIIGAGGLGSPVALYLAAAGIGRIGLVDDDVVDPSNLQRQIMHDTAHEGKLKVDSGRERLLGLNPNIQVDAICDCFNARTAEKIAQNYDILVDCTDNFATRYLINDLCVLTNKPDVYGAIFRFEGQVSVFDSRFGPCYRCVFPEPPAPELSPSCSETGVFGVLPGVIGTLQATEVIKIALGIGEPLYGRILFYDGLAAQFHPLIIGKNQSCSLCGDHQKINHLDEIERFCSDESIIELSNEEKISPEDLNNEINKGKSLILIDVRSKVEAQVSSIKDSISIPMEKLRDAISSLDKQAEYVVFCRTGTRSARAVKMLKASGLLHVRNLVGGINAWVRNVDPSQYQY